MTIHIVVAVGNQAGNLIMGEFIRPNLIGTGTTQWTATRKGLSQSHIHHRINGHRTIVVRVNTTQTARKIGGEFHWSAFNFLQLRGPFFLHFF
jgi:hypothetical protein